MQSLAQNLLYGQIDVYARVKNMIDNSVGIGDPSLIDIPNVNAQIASGTYNYQDIIPYGNFLAFTDQASQDMFLL
ncbi:MAG: hypothetical protein EZS28_006116 [Streblomastix strix]|uniref:Uncharacterized protein n=1 Tax=Streblomastix strix TaxID=222440 RepID=A0A5J4WTJ8_9EUKA|nr:MAG: hypothetical protein EZS28_006116 [Streblomastix strix]